MIVQLKRVVWENNSLDKMTKILELVGKGNVRIENGETYIVVDGVKKRLTQGDAVEMYSDGFVAVRNKAQGASCISGTL